MSNIIEFISKCFAFKKLRKANYKCEFTGVELSGSTGFAVYSIYNIAEIEEYVKSYENKDEIIYWVFDRMWEDWLLIISKDVHFEQEEKVRQSIKSLDDYAKKIIDKVIDNLKTPLGSRTSYISEYDPTLLLPVKRQPTREAIGYEYIPFVGLDVWNGYELSYLDRNGKPVNKMIRIAYDSDSESIIESKSLKLYFNSFNNTIIEKLGKGNIIDIIKQDLKQAIKCNSIDAYFIETNYIHDFAKYYYPIDQLRCDKYSYDYDPDLLEIKPSLANYPIFLKTDLLKSNCRHSGLPDWGTAYISYEPNAAQLDPYSVLKYIISFRNHREFHEECCERIMHDIMFKINPKWLRVELRYTRRGGLDINPIRVFDSIGEYNYDFHVEFSRYAREIRQ